MPTMTSLAELRQRLFHRYYVLHCLYGIVYIIYFLHQRLTSITGLSDAESKAFIALVVFSVWKSVMASTAEELVSVLILYTKFFTFCMLYWKSGVLASLCYVSGWIVLSTLFPQPWYQGPSKITELSEDMFREQVQRKKTNGKGKQKPVKYWVVMLYAHWSVACLNFEAVLAKLSLEYTAEHVKFGKIDIDVYGDLAEEYAISRDPASFDLPTLLLFREGVQIRRLPELTLPNDQETAKTSAATSTKDTITRIGWSKKAATVVKAFQLDKVLADK